MMPERVQGWAALPQGESSAARSRETGGAIGCAVLELPGGVRIRFLDQPAAFVAACAVEVRLRSSSLASQERSPASQASSAPTAASRRRLRRQKSLRRRQEAAAAAAAPASSALGRSSSALAASSAPRDVQCARTSSESEPCAVCARADEPVCGRDMDVDGQREAATAAPAALASTETAPPAALSAPRDVQCARTPSESEPCAGCARADVPVGGPDMVADGQREAATAAPAALASLDQPSRTAGVAVSAEKPLAPAAPSSASLRVAAKEAAVPWTAEKKMASEKVVAEEDAAAAEKESAHAEKESVHAVMKKTKSVDPRFLGKPSLIGGLESIEEQHDAALAVTSNRLRRKWANRLTERIKWAANFLGVGHWPLKSVWDSVLMLLVELKPARKLGTCCVGQVLQLNHVQRDVLAVQERDPMSCNDGWVLLSPAF